MRVCYACTSESRCAVAGLEALHTSEHEVALVIAHLPSGNWLTVTLPFVDLPMHLAVAAARTVRRALRTAVRRSVAGGRSRVERFCLQHGMPVLLTGSRRIGDHRAAIAESRPDVILSNGWPYRIPQSICRLAGVEAINCHGSLLPAYRGAGTTYAALIDGAAENGVTAHVIEPAFDSGPILAQRGFTTPPSMTASGLWRRRCAVVGDVIRAALEVAGRTELYRANPPSPYYERCATATYLRRRLANRLRRAVGLPIRPYEPSYDYAGCPERNGAGT